MATHEQIADYVRKYKDSFPLDSLREQLRKLQIPESDIEEGVRLGLAAPPPGPPPVLYLENGAACWRVRLDGFADFRGVKKTLDFRLSRLPEGAVLVWVLIIFKDPQNPFQMCQIVDPGLAQSKEFLESLAKKGKLVVKLETPTAASAMALPVPLDGAALTSLLGQAAAFNGGLARPDGGAALRRFADIFCPAFPRGGFEAAWREVERASAGNDAGRAVQPSQPAGGWDRMSSTFLSGLLKEGDAEEEQAALEELERVLGRLGPRLYAGNAFRLAELPVNATAGDLRNRLQLVEVAEKTGAPVPAGSFRALPVPGKGAADNLREAIERLQDPWQRLVEEVFWLWPPSGGFSDEAKRALEAGNADKTAELWRREKEHPGDPVLHNLAVLHHATALGLEAAGGQASRLKEHWKRALECWKILIERDGFWKRVAARILEVDDRRISPAAARALRRLLAGTLSRLNAELAAESSERGDAEGVSRHVALMKKVEDDESVLQAEMGRASKSLRDRIQAACDAAGAELQKDRKKGDAIARRLLSVTEPLLAALDLLYPDGGLAREAAHDGVAATAMVAGVGYYNLKTEEKDRGAVFLDILLRALAICSGEMSRRQIEENIEIVKSNMDLTKFQPSKVTTHTDQAQPADADFFFPPPPEIGQVVSAQTSLTGRNRPLPLSQALGGLGLLIAATAGGAAGAIYFDPWVFLGVLPLGYLLLKWQSWANYGHECSYVGMEGLTRASFWADPDGAKAETFLFQDAAALYTAQTQHYTNGVYQRTDYSFTWRKSAAAAGFLEFGFRSSAVFSMSGFHFAQDSMPGPENQFHLGRVAEWAWTQYLMKRFKTEIERGGSIRFALSGGGEIGIGPGFIEVISEGKSARWPSASIREVKMAGGQISISRRDAQAGFLGYGASGTISFQYKDLPNGKFFLVLLDKAAGLKLS